MHQLLPPLLLQRTSVRDKYLFGRWIPEDAWRHDICVFAGWMLCEWASRIKVIRVRHKIKINSIGNLSHNTRWMQWTMKFTENMRPVPNYRLHLQTRWWQCHTVTTQPARTARIVLSEEKNAGAARHAGTCWCWCVWIYAAKQRETTANAKCQQNKRHRRQGDGEGARDRNYCQRHGYVKCLSHKNRFSHAVRRSRVLFQQFR